MEAYNMAPKNKEILCAAKIIVLILLLNISIRTNALTRRSETEDRIGDIQAMLLKEISTKVLEKHGGDEMNTLVLFTKTKPLDTEDYKYTTENSDQQSHPSWMKIIDSRTDKLPITVDYAQSGSLIRSYKEILKEYIEIQKPKLSPKEQRKYDEANNILNEKIDGSLIGRTSGERVTKLEVYRYFRSAYLNSVEEKEKQIKHQRNTLTSAQYRNWFIYNYRILDDKENSALEDWLIHGFKQTVEEALETVNTETPNVELNEAINDLEAVLNKDALGQMSYYAEFIPTNWMEHLHDNVHAPTPTSTQYVNMILHLKEYSDIIEAIGNAYGLTSTFTHGLYNADKADVEAQEAALVDQAVMMIKKLEECRKSGDCSGIDELYEQQKNKTQLWRDDQHDLEENKLLTNTLRNITTAIDKLLKNIGDMINDYEEKSEAAKLIELAEENNLVPRKFPESGWESFHFNSEIVFHENDELIGKFSEFQPENINEEFVKIIEKRGTDTLTLEVDMHYMSVGVYRPWFHENIFKNEMITTSDDVLISPGYNVNNLKEELNKKDSKGEPLYKLPLYPTGLLVGKDIKMKIRGLNDEAGRLLIENSYNPEQFGIKPPKIITDEEGGNPFDHTGSIFGFAYNNVDSHALRYRVRQDFNGVDIEILEPHLIGQFCDIIPKFP